MSIVRSATFPFEVITRVPTYTAIREAMLQRLVHDARLKTLLEPVGFTGVAPHVFKAPYRANRGLPQITIGPEFGTRPLPRLPMLDRLYQLDVWGRDLDEVELIEERVRELLDDAPLPLTNGQARADVFRLTSDFDAVADEGDVIQKTSQYQFLGPEIR